MSASVTSAPGGSAAARSARTRSGRAISPAPHQCTTVIITAHGTVLVGDRRLARVLAFSSGGGERNRTAAQGTGAAKSGPPVGYDKPVRWITTDSSSDEDRPRTGRESPKGEGAMTI